MKLPTPINLACHAIASTMAAADPPLAQSDEPAHVMLDSRFVIRDGAFLLGADVRAGWIAAWRTARSNLAGRPTEPNGARG
jgi:hypothetical protein